MTILDKLDLLMKERGLNKRTLSQSCGIAYTTIIGLYKKGYEGARMSTIRGLANYFGVSTDYLVCDEITDPTYGLTPSSNSLADDEQTLLEDYRSLNEQGKEYIRQTMFMAKQTHKKMPDISGVERQA